MELQFPKETYDYMQCVLWDVMEEEQTQEIKLGENLPDIGRVLSVWGQPMVRSKEWRGNGMSVSGGVMAWVMFLPEEGSPPRCVETWIPFQLRWEFPQTRRDGAMRVSCLLKTIDARTVSARKLMVRAVVSAAAEALEPSQLEICQMPQLPEDLQIQKKRYPVSLPGEAGEKTFSLDEVFPVPEQVGQNPKLAYCTVQPEMTDKKVMSDKVVFRGSAVVQCMFVGEEGQLVGSSFEIPFSQYGDLERDYAPEATADLMLTLTNLEPELQDDGMLHLKAGFVGQYLIYIRPVLEVVEDAYSIHRHTQLHKELVEIPALLDAWEEKVVAQGQLTHTEQPVDLVCCMAHPNLYRQGDGVQLELPGTVHMLTRTEEMNLSGNGGSCETRQQISLAPDGKLLALSRPTGKPRHMPNGDMAEQDVLLDLRVYGQTEIPMVTGVTLADACLPDPERPSLLLRRAGHDSLWDIAKLCGSTVEDIQKVNAMAGEPEENQFLLIPLR